MALIFCPECKKEISGFASSCPNCGFPIQNKQQETTYSVILLTTSYISNGHIKTARFLADTNCFSLSEGINITKNKPYTIATGLTKENSKYIKSLLENYGGSVSIVEDDGHKENTISNRNIDEYIFSFDRVGVINCPCCNSPMVSTGQRGYSLIFGFLGAGQTVNRCGRCGHKWKP